MQIFQNLPWYGYILLGLALVSYVYKFFNKAKEGYDEPDLKKAKFLTSKESTLNNEQLFSIALYTPIAEWWQAKTNTLVFKSKTDSDVKYNVESWGLDNPKSYWDLTNYYIKNGERGYFDFIYHMIKTEPEEKWNVLINEKYGNDDERAQRYLDLLKTNKAQNILKNNGIITFDSEMELGVAAYDAATLVGHTRKVYTYGVISEEEAWKVMNFAAQLAKENFSSWEDFGKSFMLGFVLDISEKHNEYKAEIYHLYKQVLENPESPWRTIKW